MSQQQQQQRQQPRRFPALVNPDEKPAVVKHIRSIVAIHASIMMWTGIWGLLSPISKVLDTEVGGFLYQPFTDSLQTHGLMMLVGFVANILLDSLGINAGGIGGWSGPRYNSYKHAPRWWYYTRAFLCAFFMAIMWIGTYNFAEAMIPQHLRDAHGLAVDISFLVAGFLIMLGTNTLYWYTFIYPPEDYYDYWTDPDHTSPWRDQVWYHLKVIVALIGQNFFWLGSFNLIENTGNTRGSLGPWREIAFWGIGMFLIVYNDGLYGLAWVDWDAEEEAATAEEAAAAAEKDTATAKLVDSVSLHSMVETRSGKLVHRKRAGSFAASVACQEMAAPEATPVRPSMLFYLRVFVAMIARAMHNAAVWSVLDYYLFAATFWRQVIYLILGLLGVYVCGALKWNICIHESDEEEGGEEEEQGDDKDDLIAGDANAAFDGQLRPAAWQDRTIDRHEAQFLPAGSEEIGARLA